MQQRLLEDQIAAHRKAKKALSAKQRTAKKTGRVFAEEDAAQLRYISEQQGSVQKQLEQIRKQQKDHTELIDDYRTKNQQRILEMPPKNTLGQPVGPPKFQPGPPHPGHLPNIPSGCSPSSVPPGPMGQRMPPQIPSTLLTTPLGPPLNQTPPSNRPVLIAPVAGFAAGPQGPLGGPGAASGDKATPKPQVTNCLKLSKGRETSWI
ncbi:PREDICTED: histone-lysine N-methyltransferase 2C-like [Cyprinodon variegatus]|uniref:histone-lysine N-methyltransferase 2C-like n=1 Tax=Cyprinodon variegatus TaxID=28743 RepID=UPI0007427397|nr:PREDICTED: histone-lysine N-methyltransferase 2C-like [Cyprinodon variegatus]